MASQNSSTIKLTAVVALAVACAATVLASASIAAALASKGRATITVGGEAQTFSGGRCIHVLRGFRLDIGKLTAARYFSLQYSRSLANGVHHGAVLGAHFRGKYYTTPNATLTLRNRGKAGTFSGKFDHRSGGGSFRGSFSC
jgi:hypothetical protein